LNSGNAVFTSPDGSAANHATQIAGALAETLGLKVSVVVKSSDELAAAVAGNPIDVPDADHSKFLVAFANDPEALRALDALQPMIQPPGAPRRRAGGGLSLLRQRHSRKQGRRGAPGQGRPSGHHEELGDDAQAAGVVRPPGGRLTLAQRQPPPLKSPAPG